jgi:hypothetical protein
VRRNRFHYFIAGCLTVVLGISARRYAPFLPRVIGEYAPDTLWALMAFLGFGFLFPAWSTARVGTAALALSYVDELTQLYHAFWIDQLRSSWLGALILGFGFLWSDLVCYTVGVIVGSVFEIAVRKILARKAVSASLIARFSNGA